MNALKEYTFVGSPLWRMSGGKDLVRVELTIRKVLLTNRYKKRAESRRQSAPSAGEWPRQPAAATRLPTTTRSTPARRQPTMEREMPPPPTQTLPDTTRQHITHDRTQKTATIQPSPIITRPPQATSTSPVSPPKKKSRTQFQQRQPTRRRTIPATTASTSHLLYMRSMTSRKSTASTWWTLTLWSSRPNVSNDQMRRSTLTFQLSSCTSSTPATRNWSWWKDPPASSTVENIYEHREKKLEKGTQQKNIISW